MPARRPESRRFLGQDAVRELTRVLGGVPVSAYAYRDGNGRRLQIDLGHKPFATPREAERYEGLRCVERWQDRGRLEQ
jgi:hypothetical protein